jgi:CRP/FNR family transcriptional regulator
LFLNRRADYKRGDRIFSEGEDSAHFYVILSGRVKVFKTTPAGKEIILEFFGKGDPFGAVAVFEERPFPASVIALEETICALIPRRSFFDLIEGNASFVRGLLLGLTLPAHGAD